MKTCAPLLAALILASAALVPAQDERRSPPSVRRAEAAAEAQSRAALRAQARARARDLAASTAVEALKWDDRQAAVRVLSDAADLLWADYPERCVEWLRSAWELADTLPDEDADSSVRRFRSSSPRSRARAAVLTAAQKHDRQLADSFLKRLAAEDEQSGGAARRGVFDDRTARSEHLLNMALALAESDPAVAAGLAERSLSDGVSFQFQSVLLALRARDEAAANRVFDAALERLGRGHTRPDEGQVLASYLFTPGRVLSAGSGRTAALAVGTQAPAFRLTPAEADPARTHRFLAVMQGILLSSPEPSLTPNPSQSAWEFMTLSGSLAEGFKVYAPELWLPVAQRMNRVAPDLAPARADGRLPAAARERLKSDADEGQFNRLYVDGLEEAAAQESDPVARKLAFVRAAMATTPQELERGRKLADKIDETDLRRQVVSFLLYRAALSNLEGGQPEAAVRLSAEAAPLHRSIILVEAARRTAAARPAGEGEGAALARRHRALELLSEADRLLKRDDLPPAALRVRLGLVAALAPVDVARAMQAFDESITALNADTHFDPFDESAPRETGLGDVAEATLPRLRAGYGLRDAVTPLAQADLERSIGIASRLSATAVRGVCILSIARTVLSAGAAE
ncbi:MAG TPA: hypothetical protein VN282_09245 [Pyrinomonadaceae bacterium]|nr:hypothetical protein [Pyrinomonadaceae bacterium]